MKPVILYVLLMCTTIVASAQKVPSSCEAPDSVVARYKTDAYRLALRRILRNQSPLKDSAEIPLNMVNIRLRALIAVYNAKDLPARDTVVSIQHVATFPDQDLSTIIISADSNQFWMRNLRNGVWPTGEPTFDSLVEQFHLKLLRYSALRMFPYHSVSLRSDSLYNMNGVAKKFSQISGVYYATPNGYGGDGNDITDSVYTDRIELTYSIGWGDCWAGCIYRRYWKFNVYPDCSVEFVSSYGSPWPLTTGINILDAQSAIFPNPFSESIYINHTTEPFDFVLTNEVGQVVRSGKLTTQIDGLTNLPKGIYFLQLNKEGSKSITKRMVKM